MTPTEGSAVSSDETREIERIVEQVAHMLPAQGPITVFIHHNTLHAFEDLPFEEAVVEAGRRLACEAFLSEDRYRAELHAGRISQQDVVAVLRQELQQEARDGAAEAVFVETTRFELRRRLAVCGIPHVDGSALSWVLSETKVLDRFRKDLPSDAQEAAKTAGGSYADEAAESREVRALWAASRRVAKRSLSGASGMEAVNQGSRASDVEQTEAVSCRHRDLLFEARGIDIEEWIHPILIRFVGAYLDQGLAAQPMPFRERGLRGSFLSLYDSKLGSLVGAWGRDLRTVIASEVEIEDPAQSIAHSLAVLGVPQSEWSAFLLNTALALRGWSGMVRQIEERPDRVPVFPVPARLVDFLAVRLLLERACLAYAMRSEALQVDGLAGLRHSLRAELRETSIEAARSLAAGAATNELIERAWQIFHVAQLCGVGAAAVEALSLEALELLLRELRDFDPMSRQRVLHLAYERHLRHRFYDALLANAPVEGTGRPELQAVFCIDEREESLRRHLEEVAPEFETFGTAGFFGVAMYYQAATDAHPRPLCPVGIRPKHFVGEDPLEAEQGAWQRRRERRRNVGSLARAAHSGSRTLALGTLLTGVLGVFAAVPLVLRVLFPRIAPVFVRPRRSLAPRTRLRVAKQEAESDGGPAPPVGSGTGFSVDEMAGIVTELLETTGLAKRLAPLVLVLGHGSVSLNNPHESAHDCGACGGGRGGPNARAFAAMANDPRVRAQLAAQAKAIPADTFFVGGERNTCNNAVTFFDTDCIPETLTSAFEKAGRAIERARDREAHERCRRFDVAPSWLSPKAARLHVEERSVDIAQPRPEYGHASNAFCMVGRRARTRGLFLDRRAFLVSYDPAADADGGLLSRLLEAVVPVVVGISLEYYFSTVDPRGYGSGTKLPHNVASLLGVMDGAQSDLRTGLPWQMVEIHEPVRLSLVVESRVETVQRIVSESPTLARLVAKRWLFVACLDPESGALSEFAGDACHRYEAEHPVLRLEGESVDIYRDRRGHLPFAVLRPTPARRASSSGRSRREASLT